MLGKVILTGGAALLISGAAIAYPGGGMGGPGMGGPGMGGPGGGMGAGPPMTPPGQMGMGAGTAGIAHGIASQRGQFGRDFAQQQQDQHLSPQQYQQMAAQHRADALMLAAAARNGTLPTNIGPRIKAALEQDIDSWRAQFQVDRKAWQAMRDQWLASRGTMSARDWAQRRADWFAARDSWIANQRTWASTQRH